MAHPVTTYPARQGLYSPQNEHDSCGLGGIVNIKGKTSRRLVTDAIRLLENLTHRGAVGADENAGDGAGILTQIPHDFFVAEAKKLGFSLPAPLTYAVGVFFMPHNAKLVARIEEAIALVVAEYGMRVLGWRTVPVNSQAIPESVRKTEPLIRQVFVTLDKKKLSPDELERHIYLVRKIFSNQIRSWGEPETDDYYPVSFSARRIIYKGMFITHQLKEYYPDLQNEKYESSFAIVHSRFSTNTFPSWRLAHPYRMVAHNGEINTLRGNVNWMAAREKSIHSKLFGNDLQKLWPMSYEGQSDTACFDNALEFLVMGGYELPHAAMTLVPEAWLDNPFMTPQLKAFYEYQAALMEPWDGPAGIIFCDGRWFGATLDRNGLRPSRYVITKDDELVLASEAGALPVPPENIVTQWRLQPGKMLVIDVEKKCVVSDADYKNEIASRHPYGEWLKEQQLMLEDLPAPDTVELTDHTDMIKVQNAFGYTEEDIKFIMSPMALTGQEAVGSMGTDTPLSVLSNKSKLLYSYFKQNFAQVTNPPIDPIREEMVMSLVSFIGPRPNLFEVESTAPRRRLAFRQPILTNQDLLKIRHIEQYAPETFHSSTLSTLFEARLGAVGMEPALAKLCQAAEEAVEKGSNIIILSDRGVNEDKVAIPALLATAAVHHHLIRKGKRTRCGLVVETGEAREVHHFCVLAGYGAEAMNPYLAFETLVGMSDRLPEPVAEADLLSRYIKAIDKGIFKVMSKMGISTFQSYCGAQIFEAVGLDSDVIDRFFTNTSSVIEGVGLQGIAEETIARHWRAFANDPVLEGRLDVGGEYALRVRGEDHSWSAETITALQFAARKNSREEYRRFSQLANQRGAHAKTIRGLFRLKTANELGRKAIPVSEVEPAKEIVKRFSTGAMSFGSISREAHTSLAIAMNRIGGKSNTGEGGEEPERFVRRADGTSMRSAIKQVASGRFGVTTEYLVNADQIQIKVAQGAKPGEGGQLPGHKVDAVIARVRHSTKGVGLISPPPHHDIYSIEDLTQLIFDLKNVNPGADISVKLVSEVGVGTVAAGVAKTRADHIVISGFDGGTGASPLTSIKNAGSPWEIGLAETQQTLVLNGLRGRVKLQVDGGLKTGLDVVYGALLGADEFGFSTAPLITLGCVMMRKCHLNTCPVGVATQDPVLRKRFKGQPEYVINYLFMVAEEIREIMASLGVKTFNEIIGRNEWLDQEKMVDHFKAKGLDYSRIFHRFEVKENTAIHHCEAQKHPIIDIMDRRLIEVSKDAIENGKKVSFIDNISTKDRTVGTMLSGEIAKRHGADGLKEDSIEISLKGDAGQSLGAFLMKGVTLRLEGQANDYVGKGLSGGKIIVYPSKKNPLPTDQMILVGNTVLYGATSGEAYFAGVAGERFAVRNSGATAVVEGCGDHGCEYMTGGVVVVLGVTGRNFAAGMSGGVAYVLDKSKDFDQRCNMSMVEVSPALAEEEIYERQLHHSGDLEFKGMIDPSADMTVADLEHLRLLIEKHVQYTGSRNAASILKDWENSSKFFRKVMPVEYRKALLEMTKEKSQPEFATV